MTLQATIAALFIQSFGAYAPFWMAEFGWSRTTVSLAYSLHRTESGLLGPLHGWLLQRVSPRRVVTAGVLLLGIGFLGLAFVVDFTTFLIVFLVQAVGASLCGVLSLMTVLVNWFERRRTTVLGLLQTGMSVGGLAVPLVALGLAGFGWRGTAFASGLIVLAVGLPAARLMHRHPSLIGAFPDGVAPREAVDAEPGRSSPRRPALGARAAVRTYAFWAMSIGHAASVSVVAAVSVHFVLFAVETLGLGVPLAATLFSVMTLVSIVAQLIGGALGDTLDKRWLAAGGASLHAAAMVVLAFASSMPAVALAAVLHGAAWGLRGPLMGPLRVDYFGNASFSTVMGFSSMIVMLGSVGGPLVVARVVDATGTYRLAFLTIAAIAGLGALAFLSLRPPQRTLATTSPR